MQIHATVVSIDGNGVALCGPPGSGKSDLALRLIGNGAVLVTDDRCDLRVDGDTVVASPPSEIAGLLEVRGLGIYRLEFNSEAPVRLAVNVSDAETIERLPEPAACTEWGTAVPSINLAPFEASAPDKVCMALRHVLGEVKSVS